MRRIQVQACRVYRRVAQWPQTEKARESSPSLIQIRKEITLMTIVSPRASQAKGRQPRIPSGANRINPAAAQCKALFDWSAELRNEANK